MTTIDLLRHGEAAPGICLGRDYDAPLTETGWEQMRAALGNRLESSASVGGATARLSGLSGIVSSPLFRCSAFADELAIRHGVPVQLEPRFRELGFGQWEGRSWSDLYREHGETLIEFQRSPGHNPAPGGEHYADFEARIGSAWEELLQKDGHWLLVAHAGVIRAILRKVLGFPLDRLFSIQIPHAGLVRIEQIADLPPRLVFLRP